MFLSVVLFFSGISDSKLFGTLIFFSSIVAIVQTVRFSLGDPMMLVADHDGLSGRLYKYWFFIPFLSDFQINWNEIHTIRHKVQYDEYGSRECGYIEITQKNKYTSH